MQYTKIKCASLMKRVKSICHQNMGINQEIRREKEKEKERERERERESKTEQKARASAMTGEATEVTLSD